MKTLAKALLYVFAIGFGLLIGILLNGLCVETELLVRGQSASNLSAQDIVAAATQDASSIQQRTTLKAAGKAIVSAEGSWLMWVVVFAPALVFTVIARAIHFALDRSRTTS